MRHIKWIRERAPKWGRKLREASKVPLSKRLARFSDWFELAGIGCLVAAAFMWVVIVGMIVLGIALIYLGWVTHEPS